MRRVSRISISVLSLGFLALSAAVFARRNDRCGPLDPARGRTSAEGRHTNDPDRPLAAFLKPGALARYDYTYRAFSATPHLTPADPSRMLQLKGEVALHVLGPEGDAVAEFSWDSCEVKIGHQAVDPIAKGQRHRVPLGHRGFPHSLGEVDEPTSTLGMHSYFLLGVSASEQPYKNATPFWRGSPSLPLVVVDPGLQTEVPLPGILVFRQLSPEVWRGAHCARVARFWKVRRKTGRGNMVREYTDNAILLVDGRRGLVMAAVGRLLQTNLRIIDTREDVLTIIVHEYSFAGRGNEK